MPAAPIGALGRPHAHVLAALNICKAELRRDKTNQWVEGMAAAGWWILGYTPHPPMSGDDRAEPTVIEIGEQMRMAGLAYRKPGALDTPEGMYARGAYRMITYALGYTDELPLEPTPQRRAT